MRNAVLAVRRVGLCALREFMDTFLLASLFLIEAVVWCLFRWYPFAASLQRYVALSAWTLGVAGSYLFSIALFTCFLVAAWIDAD
jgi:hypothetical protein